MSLTFYCLPREGHPTFDTRYSAICTHPAYLQDCPTYCQSKAFHSTFGNIRKEATVSVTLYQDSDTDELTNLLKDYRDFALAHPEWAIPYDWFYDMRTHAENPKKVLKPAPSMSAVASLLLEWEKDYGIFYARIFPAVDNLIKRLKASDNTKCFWEDKKAQAKEKARLSNLKANGCTCHCSAHPPPGPTSPVLNSEEYQALGKLYLAINVQRTSRQYYGQ